MTIAYAIEDGLEPKESIDVLKLSGLNARRPVYKLDVIQGMVDNADLTITARDSDGQLIGVA